MVGVAVGAAFDEDVGRLDVAVHESGAVRGVERAARLPDQQQRLVGEMRPCLSSTVRRSEPAT